MPIPPGQYLVLLYHVAPNEAEEREDQNPPETFHNPEAVYEVGIIHNHTGYSLGLPVHQVGLELDQTRMPTVVVYYRKRNPGIAPIEPMGWILSHGTVRW